jgi:hypothetical protein
MTENLPATIQSALQTLPELPRHYNPIKAMGEAERTKLLDAVLAHYECGVSIYTLAETLGVDNATLYRQLIKHRPAEWREVRGARYHAQIEQAEKDMKEASDPLAVTRAREQLANARWMLERLQRDIYGQDHGQQVGQAIQINIGIRRDAQTAENA